MAKAIKPTMNENKRTEQANWRFEPGLIRKVKYIALMDNLSQTELVESALHDYISKWEKKNGEIKI